MQKPLRNIVALLSSRVSRMLAFGATSVVLAQHLMASGMREASLGVVFTATLIGDALLTLLFGAIGVRLGYRKVLLGSAVVLVVGLLVFARVASPVVLALVSTIGILSPSGGEAGPSGAIEQAALAQLSAEKTRPRLFAKYSLTGSLAVAVGSKLGGVVADAWSTNAVFALSAIVVALGSLPLLLLDRSVEPGEAPPRVPLQKSKRVVLTLSALFAMDSFGSGLVLQGALAHWLHLRFGVTASTLGTVFFGTNLLAAASAMLAARLAEKIGLVRTMVFTHVPANLLLMALAFAPTAPVAIALIWSRFILAQMDVPARMALVMRLVPEEERAQAATITSLARSGGSALGPVLMGLSMAGSAMGVPVVLAGAVKLAYDGGLYALFRGHDGKAAPIRKRELSNARE